MSGKDTLKKSASGMKRKDSGAPPPKPIDTIGEMADTAQRSASPAQPFNRRLLNRLDLSVQYAIARDGLPERAEIRRWARAALDVDGRRGGRITVRFVD